MPWQGATVSLPGGVAAATVGKNARAMGEVVTCVEAGFSVSGGRPRD